MISEIIELGKRIYDTSNPREIHRLIVFVGRALLHYPGMKSLQQFFAEDELRQRILERNPFPMEQATRAFFYNGSTFAERKQLIQQHYEILQKEMLAEMVITLSMHGNYEIWHSPDEDVEWRTFLAIEPGQRKEGMLSLQMKLGTDNLYQIMF